MRLRIKGVTSPEDCVKNGDPVEKPSHYNYGDIEVIDFIDQVTDSYEGKAAYLAGNVIKYVSRAPHKNGAEDIKKAKKYIEWLEEVMNGDR